MVLQLEQILESFGLHGLLLSITAYAILIVIVSIATLLLNYVAKKIIYSQICRLFEKTENKWDDLLIKRGVVNQVILIVPVAFLYFSAPLFGSAFIWVQRILGGVFVLLITTVLDKGLDVANDIYETNEVSKERPIKGYLQIAKIVFYIFGGILVISILINESPWALLTGLSAMSAVILLVFKDTLLGLVASIQFTMNNMVRIGDWIEMPKFNADGDVIDVSVNTVKVQNFDKTITTIPTYSLVSDSFKNWRGMEESEGRRIKRSIYIDINSIKFCDEQLLDKLRKIRLIEDYLAQKEEVISVHNSKIDINQNDLLNGRHLTNVGTFRAYIVEYLRNNVEINQNMTLLVRQLSPCEMGLPIELYTFTRDKDWIRYENIQSDIFDHLFAILPEFQLRPFQNPTGHDISNIERYSKN